MYSYSTKYSNMFLPGKQSQLSREEEEEERTRLAGVREVKLSGTALQSSDLIQDCLWLRYCNNTSAGCSASRNGIKYARLSFVVTESSLHRRAGMCQHVSQVQLPLRFSVIFCKSHLYQLFSPWNCVGTMCVWRITNRHISGKTADHVR